MSLYPLSRPCPKCGAGRYELCRNARSAGCDERWENALTRQNDRRELERRADALLRKYGNNLPWQRGPGCDTWDAAIRAIVEALASLPTPDTAEAWDVSKCRCEPGDIMQCGHCADTQAPATGELWQHNKRGTVYEKIGVAELQCATCDVHEGDGLVIYRGDDGKLWARLSDEFHDGRFIAIASGAEGGA